MNRLFIKPSDINLKSDYDDEIYVVCRYPRVKTGMYFISNYGNVYSRLTNKLMKSRVSDSGYKNVILQIEKSLDDKKRFQLNFKIHRLVAWEFCYRDSILKNEIDHIDNCRINNHYTNLEWVTHEENMRRITERGSNYHKSSEYFIRNICEKMVNGQTIFDIYYEYHPEEDKTYKNFEDNKFYIFLYLLATGKRHKVIRNQYNIDIEIVYPRYSKKISEDRIALIQSMIDSGHDNMSIMNKFGYYKKQDNPTLYRFIIKLKKRSTTIESIV